MIRKSYDWDDKTTRYFVSFRSIQSKLVSDEIMHRNMDIEDEVTLDTKKQKLAVEGSHALTRESITYISTLCRNQQTWIDNHRKGDKSNIYAWHCRIRERTLVTISCCPGDFYCEEKFLLMHVYSEEGIVSNLRCNATFLMNARFLATLTQQLLPWSARKYIKASWRSGR